MNLWHLFLDTIVEAWEKERPFLLSFGFVVYNVILFQYVC